MVYKLRKFCLHHRESVFLFILLTIAMLLYSFVDTLEQKRVAWATKCKDMGGMSRILQDPLPTPPLSMFVSALTEKNSFHKIRTQLCML